MALTEHEALAQCWLNAGPASCPTLSQHSPNASCYPGYSDSWGGGDCRVGGSGRTPGAYRLPGLGQPGFF